ncbi:MAG: DUF58 domain-containing protein [Caldilineales bacterium]|nr:DUF58 domain-containing protein [Caldilineales bacterium]
MRTFAPFLGFLLLLGVLLQLDFLFYILYVLAGLWLLARFGFGRSLQRLHWQRRFADHAFLGDQAVVEVAVQHRGRLPLPWLKISDSVPIALFGGDQARVLTSLAGGERFTLRYTLDCNRRGLYTLGPLTLSGGDPLGFFETTFSLPGEMQLTVYPQILPLPTLGLDSRQPFGVLRSRQRLFEDPARLAGTRDYRTGDSIRRIHWKASAHSASLQVKKIDPAIALESALLLNLNQEDHHARSWRGTSEWAIVLAASLAHHLSQAGQAVGLQVHGVDPYEPSQQPRALPPRAGHAHLMQVLEVLARVSAAPMPATTAWLQQAGLDLDWGTTLLVITPQATAETSAALHQWRRRGCAVILLITEPYAHFDLVQRHARQLGLHAFNITHEGDLQRWISSRSPLSSLTSPG